VEEQVRRTIDVIRPAIQADGGDIHLRSVDVETGLVVVELSGACVSCPASTVTMKAGVERILKDRPRRDRGGAVRRRRDRVRRLALTG
jgi:Fe-S cluster biogenesis protein NfuA